MKKRGIIILVIVVILACAGGITYFLGQKNGDQKKLSDKEKFKKEYSLVADDNVFVYKSAEEVIKIMENGTGVVYLGFPECPWCQNYVVYLNEVANKVGLDKIYYYNILEDRENNTENYKKMVKLLNGSLQYDDEGNERIYVPNVSFHIEGKLIFNDYESSKDTKNIKDPNEYWTEERVTKLKKRLEKNMKSVKNSLNVCTDCNK